MKTILIVDDSSTILMSLGGILGKAGFQVETAGSGVAAIDRLNTGLKPQLIITDINMPRMDGIELIRNVRRMGAFRFLPILVLTTESQQKKRDEAKAAGATGWLVKPVGGSELLPVIKQVLPGA
ncbi:response regulator [Endothiovibrio diazotrophicus]